MARPTRKKAKKKTTARRSGPRANPSRNPRSETPPSPTIPTRTTPARTSPGRGQPTRTAPTRTPPTTPTPSPTVPTELVVPWDRDPEVARLTAEIIRLENEASRGVVEAYIQIARHLATIRARLGHGNWAEWLKGNVPFTPRTVTNYFVLAQWAEKHREEFERFKHLGPSKLYNIAVLDPARRNILIRRNLHRIPGTGRRTTLDRMTFLEFKRVIDGFTPKPDGPPPLIVLVRSYRSHLVAINHIVETLASHPEALDPTEAQALHTELLEAAKKLEASLDL